MWFTAGWGFVRVGFADFGRGSGRATRRGFGARPGFAGGGRSGLFLPVRSASGSFDGCLDFARHERAGRFVGWRPIADIDANPGMADLRPGEIESPAWRSA